jgi:hypothetical protein
MEVEPFPEHVFVQPEGDDGKHPLRMYVCPVTRLSSENFGLLVNKSVLMIPTVTSIIDRELSTADEPCNR